MSIEEKLVQTLAEMGLTISTAESCTGGMVASTIVDIAGASDIFNEGFITYSNEAKMKYLNVSEETLEKEKKNYKKNLENEQKHFLTVYQK